MQRVLPSGVATVSDPFRYPCPECGTILLVEPQATVTATLAEFDRVAVDHLLREHPDHLDGYLELVKEMKKELGA